jgi:beta-glucosidase-like glycosyl hydrolase
VDLAALLQAVLVAIAPPPEPPDELAGLTAREKAALVVVSGLPAPRGVAGVIVRRWDRDEPRPRNALVLVDQEGGAVRVFPDKPPAIPASGYESGRQAFAAGKATGRALRSAGAHVVLAPVLDLAGGPLGSRHFRRPELGVSFARGLAAGRAGACVKHFPGLGSTAVSTDESPQVRGRLRARELRAFGNSIRAGVPCVMVGHAFYPRLGRWRASFSPQAYRLLRRTGFDGVAITDSVSVFGSRYAVSSALLAVRAGADLVLFTNGPDARRAIRALVPLARRGALDEHVRRVLALRRALGFARRGVG